jgi:D-proline reductase (dithiol) PrdB
VGLVQREIEAAGIPTITLTTMADVTASVSPPRMAALEYPLGIPFGLPGDRDGQRAILRATLAAFQAMDQPGQRVDLPMRWPDPGPRFRAHPSPPPPIVTHLRRRPWRLRNLMSGDVP